MKPHPCWGIVDLHCRETLVDETVYIVYSTSKADRRRYKSCTCYESLLKYCSATTTYLQHFFERPCSVVMWLKLNHWITDKCSLTNPLSGNYRHLPSSKDSSLWCSSVRSYPYTLLIYAVTLIRKRIWPPREFP